MAATLSWFSSLVIALLTGVLGLVSAGLIANACVTWYRVSSFEGASGYFVVFTALLGGLAAAALGLATARLVAGSADPGFLKALGLAAAMTLGIAGLAAVTAWKLGDVPPKLGGLELDLAVEIRLPVGTPFVPSDRSASLLLGSVVNHRQRKSQAGELEPGAARQEAGRWIVPGSVFLFTMRGLRSISLELGGQSVAGFIVPLPARPGTAFEQWSEWGPRPPAGEPPWPDSKPSYRFRVVRRVPAPPEPEPDVVEAEEWESRQNELAAAIRSADAAVREPAMGAVPRLSTVAPEVSAAVLAEGRAIADGIRQFNTMKAEDPRFYDVQIELRGRFRYWHRAWWMVHQLTGIDGRAPVQEILDLAQVRATETSLSEIVANARAHLGGIPAGGKAP